MNHLEIAEQLRVNAQVFKSLFSGLSKEQTLWRASEDKWSLIEVLCHLRDEEKEDWQARTKHALFTPNEEPQPIAPQDWVKERNYQEENLEKVLEEFLKRRNQSVQWLTTLENPEWTNEYKHPKLGAQSAQLFLENWLAHDYLHIRQINKIKYLHFNSKVIEDLSYAGEW